MQGQNPNKIENMQDFISVLASSIFELHGEFIDQIEAVVADDRNELEILDKLIENANERKIADKINEKGEIELITGKRVKRVEFDEESKKEMRVKNLKGKMVTPKKSGKMVEEGVIEVSEFGGSFFKNVMRSIAKSFKKQILDNISKMDFTPTFKYWRKESVRDVSFGDEESREAYLLRKQLNTTSYKKAGRKFEGKGGERPTSLKVNVGTELKDHEFIEEICGQVVECAKKPREGGESFNKFLMKHEKRVSENPKLVKEAIRRVSRSIKEEYKEHRRESNIADSKYISEEEGDSDYSNASEDEDQYMDLTNLGSPQERKTENIQNSKPGGLLSCFKKKNIGQMEEEKNPLTPNKNVANCNSGTGAFVKQLKDLKLKKDNTEISKRARRDSYKNYSISEESSNSPASIKFVEKSRLDSFNRLRNYSGDKSFKTESQLDSPEYSSSKFLMQFSTLKKSQKFGKYKDNMLSENSERKSGGNEKVPICGVKRVPWWAMDKQAICDSLKRGSKVRMKFFGKTRSHRVDLKQIFGRNAKRMSEWKDYSSIKPKNHG